MTAQTFADQISRLADHSEDKSIYYFYRDGEHSDLGEWYAGRAAAFRVVQAMLPTCLAETLPKDDGQRPPIRQPSIHDEPDTTEGTDTAEVVIPLVMHDPTDRLTIDHDGEPVYPDRMPTISGPDDSPTVHDPDGVLRRD